MQRTSLAVANWKMNGTTTDLRRWAEGFAAAAASLDGVEIVVCAPFLHIPLALATLPKPVRTGAQDVSAFENGAHTGDVSAQMLTEFGVSWCIVGHSERRAEAHDTNETVAVKARRLADAGMRIILCVGETLDERRAGLTESRLEEQLTAVLKAVPPSTLGAVAYEPVWAIGTGEAASPETAQAVAVTLRGIVEREWGAEVARRLPILYGGSVNEKNAAAFFAQPDLDGALVGGAALHADRFAAIAALLRESRS